VNRNNIAANGDQGISFHSSSHNSIDGNYITDNNNYGIGLDSCANNSIDENAIAHNWIGIDLSYSSNDNSVVGNNITDNSWSGIVLYTSSSNSISGNTLANNVRGIWIWEASNNVFYHNSLVGNSQQVSLGESGFANVWDDGLPSGGNYWSDYNGTDANHDGIGDTPYSIDANNTDHYPLMDMFSEFDWVSLAAPEQRIQTVCNSTISNLAYNGTAISFNVTGEDGTAGFCRIRIPAILLDVTYKVFVNGTEATYRLLPFSNETYRYLYFNYTHSTQEVIIVPEFPSFLILPLFFMATLLAAITYRRKHH